MDEKKDFISEVETVSKEIIPTKQAFVGKVGDVVLTMAATYAVVTAARGVSFIGKKAVEGGRFIVGKVKGFL